jgi:signal transduction histidine kinase
MNDEAGGPEGARVTNPAEPRTGGEAALGVAHGLVRVVGLVGAGGASIPPLRRFFNAMPAHSGMAFVLNIQFGAERAGMLCELLQQATAMPVREAVDGEEILPDRVYVVPPAKHLSLAGGQLRLRALPIEHGQRMTADLFFCALADTHGRQATAVVLSGSGRDGALGVKRIKERGGVAVVQDPEEAADTDMPRAAIAMRCVDWVLNARQIPERLLAHHAGEWRRQLERAASSARSAAPRSSHQPPARREGLGPGAPAQSEPLIWHLEHELERAKLEWREIVEQYETSVEELKASNEELQAVNEELRSATEELETSREELQAMNQELLTVNQALKKKIDELGRANSDLHNLMGATAIATVFLDCQLNIMRFTPSAVELFSLIPADLGRPLAHLQHQLVYPDLLVDAARVLDELVAVEREVKDSGERVFLARMLPYRAGGDRIGGVVLTFVDITELHSATEAVSSAQRELEQRVDERTKQLDAANFALRQEIALHRQAQKSRQELQARLVNAQEEERGRISRELHDEVGQQITALMLAMKSLESELPPEHSPAKWRELRATAEQVGREIHQLASELRPVALDALGLSRALSGYLDIWAERSGISVDFLSSGIDEPRLPRMVETTLYRIVQEAMNNIYKHARAHSVSVSIERRADIVLGIVEDDGAGFDPDSVASGDAQHLGIAGMSERAISVGGSLTIESHVGGGTTVRVKLPVPSH